MNTLRHLLLCLLIVFLSPAQAGTTTLRIGQHHIQAEIADTPQTREQGLMGRTELCRDCGMLFVFEFSDLHGFWMKNTPLPLSIAFISPDGTILNIEEMLPLTSTVHFARGKALYALEMNKGWFTDKRIKPGDKLEGLNQPKDRRLSTP